MPINWTTMARAEFDRDAAEGEQLAMFPTPDPYGTLDLFDAVAAAELADAVQLDLFELEPATLAIHPDRGAELPEYLKPRPLSNGVMDHCEATRKGVRCAWVRHFGNTHSYDPPETMPDWLLEDDADQSTDEDDDL